MRGQIRKDCVLNRDVRNWLEGSSPVTVLRAPPPGVTTKKIWSKKSSILLFEQGDKSTDPTDSQTASEILYGIEANGWKFLEEIIVPFRLFWMDVQRGRFILARAPNEARPIFWHASQDVLAFSGDALEALGLSGDRPTINWERIPEYLVFQHVAGGPTLYKDLQAVGLGQVVEGELGTGEITLRSLWPGWLRKIRAGGRQDLKEALVSSTSSLAPRGEEEGVGFFLSGGVDSSILAWSIVKARMSRVEALTVSCPGCSTDEAPYAMQVALALGLPWSAVSLDPSSCASSLVEAIRALKMPMVSTNQLAWWLLCQEASRAKIKTCFSGEGCDGWVSGGFYEVELESLERLMSQGQKDVAKAAVMAKAHVLNPPEVIQGILDVPLDLSYRMELWRDCLELAHGSLRDGAVLYHVRTTGNRLLERAAVVAAWHGISLCLPYLQHRFLSWVLSTPWDERNQAGERKKPLKELCAALYGHELAYRRKTGFPFPLRTWLRDSKDALLEQLRELLLDPSTLNRPIYRPQLEVELTRRLRGELKPIDWLVWSLLNLELWLREVEEGNGFPFNAKVSSCSRRLQGYSGRS